MTPTERLARITRANRRRLRARDRWRALTDDFVREVMAAQSDPEARLSRRRIADDLGMHHSSLQQMEQETAARQERETG